MQDISTRSDVCAVIVGVILPCPDGVLILLGASLTVLAPYRALLAGRLFLFVCGRTLSFVSRLTGNGNECIASIDRLCLLPRPISRTQLHSRRPVLSHPTTGKTLSIASRSCGSRQRRLSASGEWKSRWRAGRGPGRRPRRLSCDFRMRQGSHEPLFSLPETEQGAGPAK